MKTILSKKTNIEQKQSRYANKNKQQTSTEEIYIENDLQTWEITIYFIYQMHIKHTCAIYVFQFWLNIVNIADISRLNIADISRNIFWAF